MGARVPPLRFAAAHVAACRAKAQIEATATLLALLGLRFRYAHRDVGARGRRAGESFKDVHATTVRRPGPAGCVLAYATPDETVSRGILTVVGCQAAARRRASLLRP